MSSVTPVRAEWEIVSGPHGLDAHGFDGVAWCWTVAGRGTRSEVVVHVPGRLLGLEPSQLPARILQAIETHGRSELEWLCRLPSRPPRLIDFGTQAEQPTMVPPLPLAA